MKQWATKEEAEREIALVIGRVVVFTMDEHGVVVVHRPGIAALPEPTSNECSCIAEATRVHGSVRE